MRKLCLFIMSLVLLSACTDHEFDSVNEPTESNVSYYRDYSSALKIAQAEILGNNANTTRASLPRVKEHYVYTMPNSTRAGGDESVAFHVINFADNRGFALVPTDVRTTPVYAYSGEGNLDMDKAIKETGFGDFMETAKLRYLDEIRSIRRVPLQNLADSVAKYGEVYLYPEIMIDGVWYKEGYIDKYYYSDTLLTTEWDQCSPYNYYYPEVEGASWICDEKAATGCGPLAIAQIMAYHRKPASLNGHAYNWDLMLSKPKYFLFEYTEASLQAAQLIYDISQMANATYGTSTAIYISNAFITFLRSGYRVEYIDKFDRNQVIESIDKSNPVYIRGSEHAWVIDGYKKQSTTRTLYYATPPYKVYRSNYGSKTDYFYHCNWGEGNTIPPMFTLETFSDSNGNSYNINNKMLIVSPI